MIKDILRFVAAGIYGAVIGAFQGLYYGVILVFMRWMGWTKF